MTTKQFDTKNEYQALAPMVMSGTESSQRYAYIQRPLKLTVSSTMRCGSRRPLHEEGVPTSEETAFQVAYDDDALYIAIICYDSKPVSGVSSAGTRFAMAKQIGSESDLTHIMTTRPVLDLPSPRRVRSVTTSFSTTAGLIARGTACGRYEQPSMTRVLVLN